MEYLLLLHIAKHMEYIHGPPAFKNDNFTTTQIISMKQFLLIASLFIILYSCKKEDSKQYSKWFVNTDSFYTNDIRADRGKAIHILEGNDFKNRYYVEFHLNYYPQEGSYPIRCLGQNPDWVCITINYKGIGYIGPKNAYLQAALKNGKASYTLEPVWFYNESNVMDSVLVRGTFNEP